MVPIGFGVWLAHFGFHFFTGALTVIPVTQNAFVELGWPVLGKPDLASWRLGGLSPSAVYPLELGFLTLGMIGAWIAAVRLGRRDHQRKREELTRLRLRMEVIEARAFRSRYNLPMDAVAVVPGNAGLLEVSVGQDLHDGAGTVIVVPSDVADELLPQAVAPQSQLVRLNRMHAELDALAAFLSRNTPGG